MVRTFIAVPLEETAMDAILSLISPLRKRHPDYRWVDRATLHLTLVFLGNVLAVRIPELDEMLREALRNLPSYDLSLCGMGAYPDHRRARVLWVGCDQGLDETVTLQNAVADAMELCGFPKENRPFSPHITVARLKRTGRPGNIGSTLEQCSHWQGPTTHVNQVQIMGSELLRTGPRYTVLSSLPLANP